MGWGVRYRIAIRLEWLSVDGPVRKLRERGACGGRLRLVGWVARVSIDVVRVAIGGCNRPIVHVGETVWVWRHARIGGVMHIRYGGLYICDAHSFLWSWLMHRNDWSSAGVMDWWGRSGVGWWWFYSNWCCGFVRRR